MGCDIEIHCERKNPERKLVKTVKIYKWEEIHPSWQEQLAAGPGDYVKVTTGEKKVDIEVIKGKKK